MEKHLAKSKWKVSSAGSWTTLHCLCSVHVQKNPDYCEHFKGRKQSKEVFFLTNITLLNQDGGAGTAA